MVANGPAHQQQAWSDDLWEEYFAEAGRHEAAGGCIDLVKVKSRMTLRDAVEGALML